MKHIQIRNSDMAWHIAANIQFPPNFDESKQYPAIISVHPFGSCKEQTSGNIYGKALAEKGYLVLAYDASFQENLVGASLDRRSDTARRGY